MENKMTETGKMTEGLFRFIDNSPTAFHAVSNAAEMLEKAGYARITGEEAAGVKPGGRYYTVRNDSALIAFRIPEGEIKGIRIVASHSDSPCFKVKETPEMDVEGHYVKLNAEGYGVMIMSTWLDRPLSIAGRVVVKEDGKLVTRLLNIDRDLCVIPNVAIHFNREINKGFAYNPQVDLLPLYGDEAGEEKEKKNSLKNCVLIRWGLRKNKSWPPIFIFTAGKKEDAWEWKANLSALPGWMICSVPMGLLWAFLLLRGGKRTGRPQGNTARFMHFLIMRKSEAAPSRGLIPPSCPIS